MHDEYEHSEKTCFGSGVGILILVNAVINSVQSQLPWMKTRELVHVDWYILECRAYFSHIAEMPF